jgi:RNA polymerase sigma-70 factor (ECF subfamily)
MRGRSYREPALELSELLPCSDASCEISGQETRLTVSAEIGRLPVKYREVILLFYYRELGTAEIAKILGIPRTAVDYRLRQAKILLKKTLKEEYFNE